MYTYKKLRFSLWRLRIRVHKKFENQVEENDDSDSDSGSNSAEDDSDEKERIQMRGMHEYTNTTDGCIATAAKNFVDMPEALHDYSQAARASASREVRQSQPQQRVNSNSRYGAATESRVSVRRDGSTSREEATSRERLSQKCIQRVPTYAWRRRERQATAHSYSPAQQQLPIPPLLLQQPVTLLVVGQVNSFGNMWPTSGPMPQQYPHAEQWPQQMTSAFNVTDVPPANSVQQADENSSASEKQQ